MILVTFTAGSFSRRKSHWVAIEGKFQRRLSKTQERLMKESE